MKNEAQEVAGCWQRAEDKTFRVLLFAKMILLLLILLIVWFMYSYQFFAPKMTEVVAHGFTYFFCALFLLLLVINLTTVIVRYRRQGKLCSRTNCSFVGVILGIMVVSTGIGSKITDRYHAVSADLSQPCSSI